MWCTPQKHTAEYMQKLSARSDMFWLSYSPRTASETSKTDFPATQGCKPWQGSITPLTMYALSGVGQKTVIDGYHRQNDSKYMFIKKSLNTCVGGHLPLSTLSNSIYLENKSKYFEIILFSSI